MANGIRCYPDVIQVLALGDFDVDYVAMAPAFSYPTNFMVVSNDTNYTMVLSFDGGVTDHLVVGPNSSMVPVYFSTNQNANSFALYLSQFTPLYARTLSTTESPTGTGLYITSFYTKPSAT